MKHFKTFFKTTRGMKPQSEGGQVKKAEEEKAADSVQGYNNPAGTSIMNAFGGGAKAPTPPPPPKDVSPDSGSLASNIGGAISRRLGG